MWIKWADIMQSLIIIPSVILVTVIADPDYEYPNYMDTSAVVEQFGRDGGLMMIMNSTSVANIRTRRFNIFLNDSLQDILYTEDFQWESPVQMHSLYLIS